MGFWCKTHFAMIQSVAHLTNVQGFPRFYFMAISDFLIYLGPIIRGDLRKVSKGNTSIQMGEGNTRERSVQQR